MNDGRPSISSLVVHHLPAKAEPVVDGCHSGCDESGREVIRLAWLAFPREWVVVCMLEVLRRVDTGARLGECDC